MTTATTCHVIFTK